MKIESTPIFDDDVKQLRKRYRNIRNDLETLIVELRRGNLPGDRIQDVRYEVYKARARNRDARRGKSGGYRVVYYVKRGDQIVLLTVYSKSDQKDISPQRIKWIIETTILSDSGDDE